MWIECRLEMIFWLFKNFVEIKVNSVSNGTNVNLEIHLHANYNDLLIIWYVKNLNKSLNGLSIILVFHGREIGSNHDLLYDVYYLKSL